MPKLKKYPQSKIIAVAILSVFLNGVLSFLLYQQNFKETAINVLEVYVIPRVLQGYREAGFTNQTIPTKNPFGGEQLQYSRITANYLDQNYFQQFGMQHFAVDMVPSELYYEQSEAYNLVRRPVVFATHNGEVSYLFDENGANYVVITNPIGNLRTMYVHLEASYVVTGDTVVAGQPIGIMGNTGFSTAAHLHYQVQIKNSNDNWVNVNPLNYITD